MRNNRTWKIFFSIALILLLLVGCSGGNNASNGSSSDNNGGGSKENTKELPPMTEEEITLTYASWTPHPLNEFLAEKFMEKYPNITVELVTFDDGGWNDNILNLASVGDLPDVYWYNGQLDVAIQNGWLGDLTEYFENDPESDLVFDTVKTDGYFGGDKMLAAATQYYPMVMLLDENLFNKMNVDMPSHDWTYSEMIDLIKKMTVPEEGIYGYTTGNKLVTIAPIVNGDADGEFGWDGEKYDLTGEWADAITQRAEFIRGGNHAPLWGTDEAEAAFGDREIWAGETGKVAIVSEAWWTVRDVSAEQFAEKGIKFVPYNIPKGDNAKTNHKPAYVDYGTISPITEHPREAYELLKFFGWSKEGWMAKIDAFKTLKNEDGSLTFHFPEAFPLIDDKDVWEAYRALLPEDEAFDEFIERAKEPISLGGRVHPGFDTFLNEVYFGGEYGNVEEAIEKGEVNAHDIAQELSDKLNQYRDEALEELY